jgi:hypothetical protein
MQEIMCTTITQNLLHARGGAGIYIFLVGLAAVFQTLIFCLQVRHEMGILTNKKWGGGNGCGFCIGSHPRCFSHYIIFLYQNPVFFFKEI